MCVCVYEGCRRPPPWVQARVPISTLVTASPQPGWREAVALVRFLGICRREEEKTRTHTRAHARRHTHARGGKRGHRHLPFCSQRTRLLCSTGLSYSLLTHIILHQFIRMKQTEAKIERSKEQWKREDKTKTLTAIEHEEKESSSQKRRTQRA